MTLGDRDPETWKEQRHVFDTTDSGELKQRAVVERTWIPDTVGPEFDSTTFKLPLNKSFPTRTLTFSHLSTGG